MNVHHLHNFEHLQTTKDAIQPATKPNKKRNTYHVPVLIPGRPATGVTFTPDGVTIVGLTTFMPAPPGVPPATVVLIFWVAAAAAASAAMPDMPEVVGCKQQHLV
jgi:hypothetical protein